MKAQTVYEEWLEGQLAKRLSYPQYVTETLAQLEARAQKTAKLLGLPWDRETMLPYWAVEDLVVAEKAEQ